MHGKAQIQTPKVENSFGYKKVVKCKFCNSKNFAKWGKRKTENRGLIQTYKCRDCGKRFTNDNGFYRMRNNESKITQAIDLYFSNLSSRKVRNHFRRHLSHNASHETVLDWCRRYVLKVNKFVDKLQPQLNLSGKIYADETDIPRGCNTKRKGGDKFWCSVDWDSRYIPATLYSPNPQNLEDAKEFMKRIKKAKSKPKYIQTDFAGFYPRAVRNVFSTNIKNKKLDGVERVKHIRMNVARDKKHNVRIETVFSKIKDRVDDFRGLKSLWSAPILMTGIVLQHNFIEAHTTTGKVPCELANLKMELGQNRWLGLIRLASY